MPTNRVTYKYHFKLGNKIVQTGITNNIDLREMEHQKEPNRSKGHIFEVGHRTTYENAVEWLREQAKQGKPIREQDKALVA